MSDVIMTKAAINWAIGQQKAKGPAIDYQPHDWPEFLESQLKELERLKTSTVSSLANTRPQLIHSELVDILHEDGWDALESIEIIEMYYEHPNVKGSNDY